MILTVQTNSGCISETYSKQIVVNSNNVFEYDKKKEIIKSYNILGGVTKKNKRGLRIDIDSDGNKHKMFNFK